LLYLSFDRQPFPSTIENRQCADREFDAQVAYRLRRQLNLRHKSVAAICFKTAINRFSARKTLICWKLVRYIHLNPLCAGLVNSMNQLDRYRYCGHSVLMGKINNDWQDSNDVLKLFGKQVSSARKRYREFVEKGVKKESGPI
jgi:hypothetical protein